MKKLILLWGIVAILPLSGFSQTGGIYLTKAETDSTMRDLLRYDSLKVISKIHGKRIRSLETRHVVRDSIEVSMEREISLINQKSQNLEKELTLIEQQNNMLRNQKRKSKIIHWVERGAFVLIVIALL